MATETLEQIFSRFPAKKKDGLIPILQEIQNQHGYLTEELLAEVGVYLQIPANKLYGVATFYYQFRFHPHGRYHFRICRGTACHLSGSSTLLHELEQQLKVKPGQISKDRKFSFEVTNCLGGCQSAPVLSVNDQYYTGVTVDELTRIIHSLKEKTD
jgi:NADH-quinone oxidoreductase E subunit